MLIKIIHTYILPVLAMLLIPALIHAAAIEVTPREVFPGDILLLNIQTDGSDRIDGEFRGDKINLSPVEAGHFIALVPVEINSPPGEYHISVTEGGSKHIVPFFVRRHKFKTIKLTLPEEKVTLSPENQNRVEKEYILQKKIWGKNTDRSWHGQFMYPLETEISTAFGVRRIMNEKKTSIHRGTDFRGNTGTPVKAVNSGMVVLSRDLFYGGNTLIVDHGMGLYSVYMHLSEFTVTNGGTVEKGQIIGFVGSSGRATGPHLHLSVKLNGISVNPESLFKLKL